MEQPLLPQKSFEKNKKFIFYVILYGITTQCMNLSILGPFFPVQAKEYDISETMIGLIFSGFPLGAIVCTLFIRKWMNMNRKVFMICGIVFYVLGMVGFASAFYIENKEFIISSSIFCRFLMGIGMSMYDNPSLSFIPLLFKHKIDRKLSIIEGMQNIGFMLGPLLGTLLYNIGDFQTPFFVLAGIQSATLPLLLILFPKQSEITEFINDSILLTQQALKYRSTYESQGQNSICSEREEEKVNRNSNDDNSNISNYSSSLSRGNLSSMFEKVSYIYSISHFQVFLIFIMIFLTASGFLFLDSAYAPFLETEFDLDQDIINYIFVGSYTCSSLSALIVSFFTHSRPSNYKIMLSGFFIGFLSYFFIGPAQFFHFPKNLAITIFFRYVIACCQSVVYIPAIKEFYFTISSIYMNKVDDDQTIGNMASTLYVISMQSGEFIGPIAGQALVECLNFQMTSAYIAILGIVGIIFVYLFKKLFKQFEFKKKHFEYFQVKQRIADISSNPLFDTFQHERCSSNASSNATNSSKEYSKI
ncbi:MFS transporter (macronuclear) [Tetrahymena thermophila SB210]|uniref:MFS transporter n=1 Tax=Tetrahymena thermophila (strain SB210) TaxID=312017 RepID=I7LXM3_TETTS|nr:MFS transporter [Tetrahymena thermophila SB210]EAS04923.1 MFS transporter [Tetrahymena thermophila SB210]|eukprot:XP_001025168.1 MFS transporter [Tetrahymena thermophila SB210]